MGEAKRRAAQGKTSVEERLRSFGIDTTEPGFYDLPSFQARERADPAFLENYGRFVRERTYDQAYLDRARLLIPAVATALHDAYGADGRTRSCMDAGLALSKMLEELGIWNFVVRGAFSAEVVGAPESIQMLHAFGQMDDGSNVMGHVWLYAPPFVVVDPTAKLQGYASGSPLEARIAKVVLATESISVEPTVKLLVDVETRQRALALGRADQITTFTNAAADRFLREFPGTEVTIDGVRFVYLPTAMTAPDEAFSAIGTGPGGLPAQALWADTIRPAIESQFGPLDGSAQP